MIVYVDVGYIAEDCSVDSTSLPNVLALANNGLCDTSKIECTNVLVIVENLFYTDTLSCRIEVINIVFLCLLWHYLCVRFCPFNGD